MSQLQEREISFETPAEWVEVASAAEIFAEGHKTIKAGGNVIALFNFDGKIYAVDNRCPHMGFPLDKGSVRDGILTCHWHHARFDLASGGTFDLWADDVRNFPVKIEDGKVWLDLIPQGDSRIRQRKRLSDGLERNIRLVIAKATLGLMSGRGDISAAAEDPFRIGLLFAARNRRNGWSTGATILTVMMNLLPHLDEEDKPRAIYTGLTAVARDCDGQPARFAVEALPNQETDLPSLKRWFRQFIEVRDTEGAERCIVSAVQAGYNDRELADLFFAAATDHRYIEIGHPLDFTNKAFEALDQAGWQPELVAPVLASLVPNYTSAQRQEEANEWRNPVDLVALLETAFAKLVEAKAAGQGKDWEWRFDDGLVNILLGDDPQAIIDALLDALRNGASLEQLAAVVAYTAARRVAHYGITNEYGDWNTVHHTFTFANAVHQGMRRASSPELMRGVLDAAMSIYLDRFLNTPPTRLPVPRPEEVAAVTEPNDLLTQLLALLDKQQQVNEAARLVALYLQAGGSPVRLRATLGKALLREDAGFHPIQSLEATFRQYDLLSQTLDSEAANHVLIAAVRYLAAHSPTARSANQTYQIALRLNRGEKVFEDEE